MFMVQHEDQYWYMLFLVSMVTEHTIYSQEVILFCCFWHVSHRKQSHVITWCLLTDIRGKTTKQECQHVRVN